MSGLILPDQLPTWVPGQLTVRSPDDWQSGLSVRGYHYQDSDVCVPAMRDYVVIAYRRGVTSMRRRVDGDWATETMRPGDVSLLTRAAESHWVWSEEIDVVHVYLTQAELSDTCRQMYEREVTDIDLRDVLKVEDPGIYRTALAIAREAATGGAGAKLLVDSLTVELCVRILRDHAEVVFRAGTGADGLSFAQQRAVVDYIESHLSESITLEDLAAAVAMSKFHFARRFRATTGSSPHGFVTGRRVQRAKQLLARTGVPLLDVAAQCGFSDQSHMTRVFNSHVGTTPGQFRSRT